MHKIFLIITQRRIVIVVVVIAAVLLLVAGIFAYRAAHQGSQAWTRAETSAGLSDAATKLRAARIISSFENSTTEIQYGYADILDDGRGITAGRAGFTSGTGDMLQVVENYSLQKPDNPLAGYLPALRAVNGSQSAAGLDGLPAAWKQAAADLGFRQVQDAAVDELYFNPAIKRATTQGIHSPIGQLIIWDTITQHGEGDDPDGLPALIARTDQRYPGDRDHEERWLRDFLDVRESVLNNAHDPDTRQAWRESVDRVHALRSLLHDPLLQPPVAWSVYGDDFRLTE